MRSVPLLSLLLASFVTAVESEPLPCQCTFTDSDEANCKVYGQLGDGNIIGWHRASQECLDVFNIKDQAIDPETLTGIFPNADGTDGSPSQFIAYLRFNDGSVASGIKASFDDFFVESTTQPGKYVFKDEITVDGVSWVCSSDMGGNEGLCWTALRTYFSNEPGSSEMADIGKSLYNQQAVSREKEQSLVRIRLCSDGPTAECGLLSDQVQQEMTKNPDKFCSAYGLGPAGYDYPKCSSGTSPGPSPKTDTSASASASASASVLAGFSFGVVAVAIIAVQGIV